MTIWRSVYNEFYKLQYNKFANETNEIIFTNKVPHFADTINYIYANKPIQLLGVLRMPYEKYMSNLIPKANV